MQFIPYAERGRSDDFSTFYRTIKFETPKRIKPMNSDKKDCFGVLDIVFPMGESGLRESPSECFQCSDRTACLKAAMKTKEGLAMKGEVLDRAAASGMVGRFKRWSRKKELHRLMKEK